MQVKHWGVRLMLGAVLFAGVLACNISDTLIAQTKPTTIPTRTPRPTFTPLPPPSPTVAPTVAVATKPPTARPATARPPTAKPVVVPTSPPPPPQPTTHSSVTNLANKGANILGKHLSKARSMKGSRRLDGVTVVCQAILMAVARTHENQARMVMDFIR